MKCYFTLLFLSTLICYCYGQYSGLGSSGGKSKSDEYDIIFDLVSDFMNRFQSKSVVIHSYTDVLKSFHFNLFKTIKSFQGNYILEVDGNSTTCEFTWDNMDLHFVPFPQDHLDHVMNCWKQRKRNYKELWLIYHEDETSIENVVEIYEGKNATMDFDDDVVIGINDGSFIHLWELYRIGPESPIQFIQIGQWSPNKELQLTTKTKWDRRRNLKRHHFKFTSLVETPFMSKIELNPFTGIYDIEGSFVDLIDLFAETLNFTYTLEPPPDNAWGGKQEDGTWNGMMNLVQNQLVDIATTSLFQTREREEDASFGLPLKLSAQRIFIKNPANVYNYTAYLEPLTYMCWVLVLFFLIFVPIFIFVISKQADEYPKINFGSSYEAVWTTLVMMGSPFKPVKLSTRIIYGSMLVASALLYYHWEAMLVSYLSSRKLVMPFTNVEDMYLNTDFRLALIPSTTYEDNFRYSKIPIWQNIFKERLEPHLKEYENYPDHLFDMLHFIRNDFSTALYDSFDPIAATREYQDCLILAVDGEYFKRPYAWAFQKHSPYLDSFNYFLQDFIEKGTWDAIQSKYEPQPQNCPDLSGMPVSWGTCFTAYLVLCGGFLLALFVLILESSIGKPMAEKIGLTVSQDYLDYSRGVSANKQQHHMYDEDGMLQKTLKNMLKEMKK